MNKKFFGRALTTIGSPAAYSLMVCFSSAQTTDYKANLIWAIPLSIITLPLLPAYLIGDKLLKKVEMETFNALTKHLAKVKLPKDYAYIVKVDDHWLIEPFHMEGEEEEFDSEAEARLFLQCLHYHEVISEDADVPLTFWIKDYRH